MAEAGWPPESLDFFDSYPDPNLGFPPGFLEKRFLGKPMPRRREERAPRPHIKGDDRWSVWERDDFRCVLCGSRRRLSIDHVVPISKGGANDVANYQTMCTRCNAKKGNR